MYVCIWMSKRKEKNWRIEPEEIRWGEMGVEEERMRLSFSEEKSMRLTSSTPRSLLLPSSISDTTISREDLKKVELGDGWRKGKTDYESAKSNFLNSLLEAVFKLESTPPRPPPPPLPKGWQRVVWGTGKESQA